MLVPFHSFFHCRIYDNNTKMWQEKNSIVMSRQIYQATACRPPPLLEPNPSL